MDIACRDVCMCGICGRVVRKPKTLPCVHSFCERCLQQHVDQPVCEGASGGADVAEHPVGEAAETGRPNDGSGDGGRAGDGSICPICQISFEVPEGGVMAMTTDSFLERLTREMITSNSVMKMCGGMCALQSKQTIAISMCKECDGKSMFLCKECCYGHSAYCPKHTVVPLQVETVVEPGGDDDEPAEESAYCTDHPKEKLKVFCSGCLKTRCDECNMTQNSVGVCEQTKNPCKWIDIETGSKKLMENLQSLAKQKSVVLNQDGLSCSSVLKILEGDKSSAIEAVEAIYQSIVDMVLERKMSLISQIQVSFENSHATATEAINEAENNRKASEHQLAYCTALMSHGTSFEALKCYTTLRHAARNRTTGRGHTWKTKQSVWYSPMEDDTLKKSMIENMCGVIVSGVSLREFEGRLNNPVAENESVAYSELSDTILVANRTGITSFSLQGGIVRKGSRHTAIETPTTCFSPDLTTLSYATPGRGYLSAFAIGEDLQELIRSTGYWNHFSLSKLHVQIYGLRTTSVDWVAVLINQNNKLTAHKWGKGVCNRATVTVEEVAKEREVNHISVGDNNVFSLKETHAKQMELAHLTSADEMNKWLEDGTGLPSGRPHIWKLYLYSSAPCTGVSAVNGRVFVMKCPAEETPCGSISVVSYQGQFLQEVDFGRSEWGRALTVRKILGQKDGVYLALLD